MRYSTHADRGRALVTAGLATVLLVAGCYESHGRARDADQPAPLDAGAPDRRPDDAGGLDGPSDSGGADGTVREDAAPPGDGGAGFEPDRCTVTLPELFPGCYCFPEGPPADRVGRCITYPGEELETCRVGGSCSRDTYFCNDLGGGAFGGVSRYGLCVHLPICRWLFEHRMQARCFYEDGTPVERGGLPAAACPTPSPGLLCGPGCGSCGAGDTCVGRSERSGLGLCVAAPAPSSPDRCRDDLPRCRGGNACLRFALPPDVTTVDPTYPWGACIGASECRRLAGAYPARFRCEGA